MVMEEAFRKYGVTSHQLGLYTLVAIPLSLCGIAIGARISGQTGKFKLVMALMTLLPILFLALSLAFKQQHILYGLTFLAFHFHLAIASSVAMSSYLNSLSLFVSEQIISAEAFSFGIAKFAIKIGQVSVLQICSYLLSQQQSEVLLWVFTALQITGVLCVLFMKEELGRWDLDVLN